MRPFISRNSGQTKALARKIAAKYLKPKTKKAVVIGLIGDLGSGKTTFVQGFARVLGIKNKITSPTFVIMKRYALRVTRYEDLYHFDAYRVKKPGEIAVLGWKEIINNPQNLVLVEWAEKIEKILPKNCIKIYFEHVDKNKRKISLT